MAKYFNSYHLISFLLRLIRNVLFTIRCLCAIYLCCIHVVNQIGSLNSWMVRVDIRDSVWRLYIWVDLIWRDRCVALSHLLIRATTCDIKLSSAVHFLVKLLDVLEKLLKSFLFFHLLCPQSSYLVSVVIVLILDL